MILNVYAIHDDLSGFMTPVVDQNDAIAMRNFRMACDVSKTSVMSWRPSDFSLYRLGTFNSETGSLVPLDPIEVVCRGEKSEISNTV